MFRVVALVAILVGFFGMVRLELPTAAPEKQVVEGPESRQERVIGAPASRDEQVIGAPASLVTSPDGSTVVGVVAATGTTEVLAGATPDSLEVVALVEGDWDVRTVSFDGSSVALGVPLGADETIYEPGGRSDTAVVVVNLKTGEIRHLTQSGNLEPEAFSTDGRGLYVIDHRPADRPEYYRVAYIDLATGERADVYGPDKKPLDEDMQGTGRDQVYHPSGEFLYTVYTRQNVSEHGDHPHLAGFVHVLSLANQFAICVDLPTGFGQGANAAISVNPDGTEIYVVDPTANRVAVLTPRDEGFSYSVTSQALVP